MEAEERGYRVIGKFVCPDCVDDEYLRKLVLDGGSDGECDYCTVSSGSKTVLSVDALMPYVASALSREFADPARVNVPRDDDGSCLLPTFQTDTALMCIGLYSLDSYLVDEISNAFLNTDWVMAYRGSWMNRQPYDELTSLWDEFVQSIKHRTRFFFREGSASGACEGAHQILESIRPLVLSAGLIRSIDIGTVLYRCRLRKETDEWPLDSKELGAPPEKSARAGRMNPAGISYLYTALEKATALAEVVDRPPFQVVVGQFKNNSPLQVVDICDLPPLPSPFDKTKAEERDGLLFLRRFAEEISQPVAKDGAEHIDYVPSQVVCEFFAQVVALHEQKLGRIDGLAYPSAVMPSGRNLVLFPNRTRRSEEEFDHIELIHADKVNVAEWQVLMTLLQTGQNATQ